MNPVQLVGFAMRVVRSVLVLLILTGLSACSTSKPQDTASSSRDPDLITRAEIEQATTYNSAYAIVEHLRPFWLRKRGSQTFDNTDYIVVYVDGSRMGGPPQLRYVNTSIVEEIRHLDAREANMRYGTGHSQGAILVSTRNGSHLRSSR